ncbi:mitochondrial intermembrane space import and assembly protein 40 [Chloropicon roscoffensis]|uniref:Mitochondrial intermembrane space import and assembly protein 40 n=1 Tax=Chloropicon roscoffensis TaxID=1461544 RepID=A0AAX4PEI9_9CHLO
MEAASRDEEVENEVKRKIDEALACTCVDDLKEGPCGDSFVEAFSCFIRSQRLEDTDCSEGFGKLKECMIRNPEQFEDFAEAFKPKDGKGPED